MTKRSKRQAPSGLSAESRRLWERVTTDYDLTGDAAGEQLLLSLCEVLDRLRQCQAAIKKDGLTIVGSQGQLVRNPLLATEAEARRSLLAHCRALKLEPEDF